MAPHNIGSDHEPTHFSLRAYRDEDTEFPGRVMTFILFPDNDTEPQSQEDKT